MALAPMLTPADVARICQVHPRKAKRFMREAGAPCRREPAKSSAPSQKRHSAPAPSLPVEEGGGSPNIVWGNASAPCPSLLWVEHLERVCWVRLIGGEWTHEDAETAALWCLERLGRFRSGPMTIYLHPDWQGIVDGAWTDLRPAGRAGWEGASCAA